ncbi:aminotransferase class III-fold pyridoxal phosphate-dependent enzyme [Rhizobium leguminosarum]|uniref:aminotransferase class III-fold pyridoxal phosphate-dependent enzyme n=1 Tax=Rhizobium leguminosarum TaxID=384 RepID=UPI003F95372D
MLASALIPSHEPIVKAQGSSFQLRGGQNILDISSQTLNLALGHTHPEINQAVVRQTELMQFASSRFASVPFLELSDRLALLAPPSLNAVVLKLTNGSDAVETAVKIARIHTQRPLVACLPRAWHGESFYTLSMSSTHAKRLVTSNCDVVFAQQPTASALAELILQTECGAAVIDPAQVSHGLAGGGNIEELQKLAEACKKTGTLLIFDEIQTFGGFLGPHLFAHERFGVLPDLICLGKALGAGFPLAAVVCREDLGTVLQYNDAEFTYGGHPVSCAAALAALDAFSDLKPLLSSKVSAFAELVNDLFDKATFETHQIGLMATITRATPRFRELWCARLVSEAMKRGIYARPVDNGCRILIKPPINTAMNELEEALCVLAGLSRDADAQCQKIAAGDGDSGIVKESRVAPEPSRCGRLVQQILSLDLRRRTADEQETLCRQLWQAGIPTQSVYGLPADPYHTAVPAEPLSVRTLAATLSDRTVSDALVNGLVLRQMDLLAVAHDNGYLIGDRDPQNTIVIKNNSIQLANFCWSYSGATNAVIAVEEVISAWLTLTTVKDREIAPDLSRRIYCGLQRRFGSESVRAILDKYAVYLTPSFALDEAEACFLANMQVTLEYLRR